MANILILEDSEDSFEIQRNILSGEHKLIHARSIEEAKNFFNSSIDLLILDIGLPDGDGFEFCFWVRNYKKSSMPIIFVSANTSTASCVTGLTSGGDDYITKPFHPSEFIARINSKLKLKEKEKEKDLLFEVNGISIDLSSQKAFVKEGAESVELNLTPIEFKILQIFLESPGKAIGRDIILDRVWGSEVYVYPRSVDTHVSKLRRKLGKKGELISSVHGTGYRFIESAGLSQIADGHLPVA